MPCLIRYLPESLKRLAFATTPHCSCFRSLPNLIRFKAFFCSGLTIAAKSNYVAEFQYHSMIRTLRSIAALAVVGLMLGQAMSKPRIAMESRNQQSDPWPDSTTPEVLQRACGNCHSNRTQWPWYSQVPPVSWWIDRDVRQGRRKLNFSEWGTYSAKQKIDKMDSICGLISTGRMPPWVYTTLHPEARLRDEDKKTLCAWAKRRTVAAQ